MYFTAGSFNHPPPTTTLSAQLHSVRLPRGLALPPTLYALHHALLQLFLKGAATFIVAAGELLAAARLREGT